MLQWQISRQVRAGPGMSQAHVEPDRQTKAVFQIDKQLKRIDLNCDTSWRPCDDGMVEDRVTNARNIHPKIGRLQFGIRLPVDHQTSKRSDPFGGSSPILADGRSRRDLDPIGSNKPVEEGKMAKGANRAGGCGQRRHLDISIALPATKVSKGRQRQCHNTSALMWVLVISAQREPGPGLRTATQLPIGAEALHLGNALHIGGFARKLSFNVPDLDIGPDW